jgi:CheY-like chemotaxis protein
MHPGPAELPTFEGIRAASLSINILGFAKQKSCAANAISYWRRRVQKQRCVASEHPGRIDPLLTDMMLPGLTGRELAEEMLPAQPDLKAVYISGYTDDERARCGSQPPKFLQKPFMLEFLVGFVRQLIRTASERGFLRLFLPKRMLLQVSACEQSRGKPRTLPRAVRSSKTESSGRTESAATS